MLKTGMYVRCPFDPDNENEPRQFLLGQISRIDKDMNKALVKFYDLSESRKYYEFIPSELWMGLNKLNHCKILENTEVLVNNGCHKGKILCISKKLDNYYIYYVQDLTNGKNQVFERSEEELQANFTRLNYNPAQQMINYEFHNPFWYLHRGVVTSSLYTLKNATYGFETLVGSRVFLLPHQVDTIVRAISETPCRFMLADEVGLGKTIEACVIMKGLKERLGKLRTLIIAPHSLIHQWQNELSFKFWLDIPLWHSDRKNENNDLIFPLELVNSNDGQNILNENWDLCIIDETHRLLNMDQEYHRIKQFSVKVQNLLLLTATPIQQRQSEYHKLLTLLVPSRYGPMTKEAFEQLLEKQSFLRGRIHRLVRDIEDYLDDELAEDYLEDLENIANKLEDDTFTKLVEAIDINSEDMGLDAVKLALAYIGEHYQIERHILRHRRIELREEMPSRQFEPLMYTPSGSDFGFYELNTYELLLEYLQDVNEHHDNPMVGDYLKLFLSAMLSSPWALNTLILGRQEVLERKNFRQGPLTVPNTPRYARSWRDQLLESLPGFVGEHEHLQALSQTCNLWQKAVEAEFQNMDKLLDDPDLIRGRLFKVYDYLSQSLDHEKFLIFTSWSETLEPFIGFLTRSFGQDAVASFYSGLADDELQLAVDRFQSDPKCRFLLSDELGGEGRNFQMADAIVHIDLPWSPIQLEQRIGRLDRIGRDKPVLSVVACSQGTIEEGLFNLWNEGLNIFSESPSGLEIALGDIHEQILNALRTNLLYGLDNVLVNIRQKLEEMRKIVEEERYYDMARQLDRRMIGQLSKLIETFDRNEGQSLYNTMMSWTSSTGLIAEGDRQGQTITFRPKRFSFASMQNTLFIPPRMENVWLRTRTKKQILEIRGTFSRNVAVSREDLVFYAPGDPFFDAIVSNADECARGRACAVAIKSTLPFDWQGFVFTWSPVINPRPLLALGLDIENIALAQGYMPLEQIITLEGLSENDQTQDEKVIREFIEQALPQVNNKDLTHLGKRSLQNDFLGIKDEYMISNIDWFKNKFPSDMWSKLVKGSRESSLVKVKKELERSVEVKKAKDDFQRRINGIKASNLYYGSNNSKEQEVDIKPMYQALLNGLKQPNLRLESIAFVWVVGTNE